jgi:hypothetical protein
MWTVVAGRLVYEPRTQHIRSALGVGFVPDVVTLMQREADHA